MSIGIEMQYPGGTEEQYDAIRRQSDEGSRTLSAGLILHISGPTDTDWRILSVWETRPAFDAFMAGTLRHLTDAAGPIGSGADPIVTEFAVHDVLLGGSFPPLLAADPSVTR